MDIRSFFDPKNKTKCLCLGDLENGTWGVFFSFDLSKWQNQWEHNSTCHGHGTSGLDPTNMDIKFIGIIVF